MSTALLYHAFHIKGLEYRSTSFLGNSIIFQAEMTERFNKCPQCGCHQNIFKGQKTRLFKMGPMGRKQVLLQVHFHRI